MILALYAFAISCSKGLIVAASSSVSNVNAVPVMTEQCNSNSSMAAPEQGRALLAHRTKLERVTTEKWQEESVEQALLSGKSSSAVPDQALAAEFAQLAKDVPVRDIEDVMQVMRDKRKRYNQTRNSTDPEEQPFFAPAPATPEFELPKAEDSTDEAHTWAKFIVVPISLVFFIVYNVSTMMEKFEITAVPESIVVIAIGGVLGFFMKKYASLEFFENPESWAALNTLMLNFMLLPIIIFASGWALRRHDFYSQLPYILLFAVGGTAISTCVVAGLMHAVGLTVRWRTAFAYASLISATDPVATLTTYSKLKVQPLLNIMVFGESTINDAVAIVLFKIFNSNEFMGDPSTGTELDFGFELLRNISWGIFKTFFGSMFFGVLLGMLYTFIARGADMRQNKKGQILVIFMSCYLTYGLAESVHLSGIIAEIFSSLVMGVYMRPHLSNEGCVLTTFFVKQIASLADCAVFLVVGVSVVQLTPHGWKLGMWVALFCLIARFVATVPTAYLVNGLKSARGLAAGQESDDWNLLKPKHIFMMWHGGLRGGIALALAWELGPWVDMVEGKPGYRHSLHTATFLIIIFFLIFFGGSTSAFLKYFEIPMGEDYPENYLSKTEYSGLGVHGWLKDLDKNFFTPILIGHEAAKQQAEDDDQGETNPDADAEEEMGKSMALRRFCQH